MKSYFLDHGITFQISCTRTAQQNGIVEREHHILNVALSLCFQGDLPTDFWGECVLSVSRLFDKWYTI